MDTAANATSESLRNMVTSVLFGACAPKMKLLAGDVSNERGVRSIFSLSPAV